MRLLIIEDSRHIARMLDYGLKPHYAVDVCLTGKEGLTQAESTPYDAIILDLNLPDISGEEVCALLRKNNVQCPILVVTGNDSTEEKIKLLDLGADDYITKPFSLGELRARIRATFRRSSSTDSSHTVLVAGDLELNPASRTVTRAGNTIELRRKEFDLLEYLIRNQDQALSRNMILDHIWDRNEDLWANVIDVHIKHLRDKIDRPFGSNLIKTIHGVGYKLEAKKEGVANT